MTWQANGNYYTFNEQTIRSYAPSVSGVYGLYNIKHQLLIGNTTNIKDALLRNLKETRFRLRRLTPTGFVFEVLPPETRELRAQELIREYTPILQANPLGLAALWHSCRAPGTVAFLSHNTRTQPNRPAIKARPERPFRRFDAGREQFGKFAVRLGGILVAVGFITWAAHRKVGDIATDIYGFVNGSAAEINEAAPGVETAAATPPINDQAARVGSRAMGATDPLDPGRADAIADSTMPDTFEETGDPVGAGQGAKDARLTLLAAKPGSERNPRIVSRRESDWSVQVLATTDRDIADQWLSSLKAKSYDAFVVSAEIDKQTWYRVRTGHFKTAQQAQPLRDALRSTGGFHDAFIATNTGSQPLAVLKPHRRLE